MTIDDSLGLSDFRERLIVRALPLVLVGLIVFGVATIQTGMVVRVGIALGVTLLLALLRREYGYSMDAGPVLWITVAMILHVAG